MQQVKSNKLPAGLTPISFDKKDTEGRIIVLDQAYSISNGLIVEAIDYIKSIHGEQIDILPMSGISAGGDVFNTQKYSSKNKKIGLVITPPQAITERQSICFTKSDAPPTQPLKTHELHIDDKNMTAYAGAGVVLDQLTATVQEAFGLQYAVLGTDLTSSGYASVGATFMTGGMGPSRISFAASIKEIDFFNGTSLEKISDNKTLSSLAETYGYTGLVQGIAVPIYKMPMHEFGFALPISASLNELGQLIQYFYDKTIIDKNNFEISNQAVITGMELITGESVYLLNKNAPTLKGLQQLITNLSAANKTDVVFISGYAQQNLYEDPKDPLGIFADNNLSGLALEQALPFENLLDMKTIREAAPDIARSQYADAEFIFKQHTDINICVSDHQPGQCMKEIMQCYNTYKSAINNFIEKTDGIAGNVQVYGHLNPQGVDPHYRITFVADTAEKLEAAISFYKKEHGKLVQELNASCSRTNATMTGGEKGIISNIKIIESFAHDESSIPNELAHKFALQKNTIEAANSMFNWRSKL